MESELPISDPLDERQFRLAVTRLADSLSYGTDSSPFLGSGIEYVQSRPYQPGDPVKSIDWRVTARTGRVHVKEYEAPKRMPVYILVDTSASMVVTSQAMSKYAWAVQIAGGLALAALNRVSPVGVVGCGEREIHLQPSLSRAQVFQWLYILRRFRWSESTTLAQRVQDLVTLAESRSLVMVLSDLHDPAALPALKLMAQGHDLVVLRLMDPAEKGALRAGFIRGQEAETGEYFISHGRSRWLEADVMSQNLRTAGIDYLLLPINQPFVPQLRHFLRERGRMGRGAR